jgi:rhodanese-related sulfurtransferase
MRILLLFAIVFIGGPSITAQNPSGFAAECEKYISRTVPLAYSAELNTAISRSNVIILDAREKSEYNISHIPKAQYIGYDNFDARSVNLIPKTDTIYIYCSIGYRSEKIGERLQKVGYMNVFNLYGGIFSWVNSGYELVDKNNIQTREVHGYNKEWSKLLNEKRCVINLDN